MTTDSNITWQWRHFELFSAAEWHQIIHLRAQIFVLEQACAYVDPDEKDPLCFHLQALSGSDLLGTARAVPPGVSYDESSIGRVAIAPAGRGQRLGRAMMERCIDFNFDRWNTPIRISGQAYLQSFYESLGFRTVHGPYDEDGIPHYDMLLNKS